MANDYDGNEPMEMVGIRHIISSSDNNIVVGAIDNVAVVNNILIGNNSIARFDHNTGLLYGSNIVHIYDIHKLVWDIMKLKYQMANLFMSYVPNVQLHLAIDYCDLPLCAWTRFTLLDFFTNSYHCLVCFFSIGCRHRT